jgi:hypothetical protein
MHKSLRACFILISTVIILVSACAKISSPSGGLRDRLVPVIVKSVPEPATKNFRGDRITVTFNEYVVLDNITEKFMVSPPMLKKPRVFIKGKSVNVEFDEVLRDSTTYTFYFQDAIRDLNEGNILDNYKFVFSTGPVIDSLSVTGNVYNGFNLEVPEKTQVIMHRELADSAVTKHIPEYISRVDQNGYFRIDNIRSGIYRLYALSDADNSKNYNLEEEGFAFLDSTIEVTSGKNFIIEVRDTSSIKKEENKTAGDKPPVKTAGKKTAKKVPDNKPLINPRDTIILTGEYQLFLFTGPKKNHYLTSSDRSSQFLLNFTVSLPPDSMTFGFSIDGASDDAYFTERSKNNDTLKVWITDSTLYSKPMISALLRYPFTDTLGNLTYKDDTIMMRFTAPRAIRGTKIKKPVLAVETNISTGTLKPGQPIYFKTETPFANPDTSRIVLYELLDSTSVRIPFEFIRDSANASRYFLRTTLLEKKKYLFIADSASFHNIYNEASDSVGIKFSIKDPESYCKMILSVKYGEGDLIIQLLDKSERLVHESYLKKDGKLEFPLLESGFYRIRAIFDLNGDGKWTTGDFTEGRQPEPVSYYPAEIELKTGWELDQDWEIGQKNVKNQKLREKPKAKR